MAGEIQIDSVTALTASGSNIVLNNVDTATNRTNLGLGSMATQNANAVALTGGSITGTEIDLKSSGTTIYKSDGTTAVLSESGGVVTLNNGTIGSDVVFPSNHIIQVVQAKKTTGQSIGSTETGITGLSQSIVVKENSKVLICINLGMVSSPAGADAFFYLYRGGSALSGTTHTDTTSNAHTFGQYVDNSYLYTPVSFMYLDESITSAGTYTYQPYAKSASATSITINKRAADTWSGGISTIILMEFSA